MATSTHAADLPLVAEADDWDDGDSALGSASLTSSTTSISDSIRKHREENGRTYHKYKEEKEYLLPNDEEENDRLDLQHHLFTLTFNNKLFLSPAGRENKLHRVLDVGTGTGIWAIDFADDHPEAEVLGIDLSPIQPSFLPPNLTFQLNDLEEPWNFTNQFDFIYARMMTGSFGDWPKFFTQSFENTTPGGFIEVADCAYPITTDDDTLPPDSALKKWNDLISQACAAVNRPIDSALKYKEQIEAAGFENVVEVKYKWPLNRWPKDKDAKLLGLWAYENIYGGLDGISLAVFTRVLGWTKENTDAFLVDVRKDLNNHKIHAYIPIIVVYGQKPKETA